MSVQKKTLTGQKKNTSTGVSGIVLGAGLVAVAAAGYMLFGPEGKQNRKKVKGWTLRAKGEILEALEKLTHVSEDSYHALVAKVMKKYSAGKTSTEAEVKKMEKELRAYWKMIHQDISEKKTKKTQ